MRAVVGGDIRMNWQAKQKHAPAKYELCGDSLI